MTDFTGFTPETIDFLWELRMNNNKAWMEENRERYRTVTHSLRYVVSVMILGG